MLILLLVTTVAIGAGLTLFASPDEPKPGEKVTPPATEIKPSPETTTNPPTPTGNQNSTPPAGFNITEMNYDGLEEIIHISKLKKTWEFKINRNIFSPDPMVPQVNPQEEIVEPEPQPVPVTEAEPTTPKEPDPNEVEQMVRNSISYEGYVLKDSNKKDSKNYALVSANGEFFAVSPGDVVLDRIKIIEINNKIMKVEVDSKIYEIQLKGDDDA